MPAAKLRPVGPSTTTRPPVMYSQPWSPTPSTTAHAPELRTAKRSPARPRKNARPRGRAVEHGVADDHVLLGAEVLAHALARADREHAARQALAGVVVGVAAQRERDARREPAAEALPGRALEARPRSCPRAGPRRRAREAMWLERMPPTQRLRLRTGSSHAHRARRARAPARRARTSSQSSASSSTGGGGSTRWRGAPSGSSMWVSRCVRSTPRAFQCSIAALDAEQVDAADRLVERAQPERGEDLAHFLGDEEEEVDDVLGRALEALAQLRVLRGDADRAGVQVAGAHHDAAGRDQRRGREAHLVGAEHRGDRRRRGRSSAGRRSARRCASAGR